MSTSETGGMSGASVMAVFSSAEHTMAKFARSEISLLAGLGVEGDAHCGATVQHRSRVRVDPTRPNLRQVHLVHVEILDRLAALGRPVRPGVIGENITTRDLDLLSLPTATLLHLGARAVVEVTGLRNPCGQLDGIERGLRGDFLDRDTDGNLVRLGGVMGVVISGGIVRPDDPIGIELPGGAPRPLEPV